MPYLQRIRSRDSSVVPLGQELTVIGRSDSCDIKLEGHSEISREHCAIHHYEDDALVKVVDLGSRNGTWVNGNRIHEETALKEGDIVRLSRKVEFRFTESEPVQLEPEFQPPPPEEMTIAEDRPARSPVSGHQPTTRNVRPTSEDLSNAASQVEKELEQQDFKSMMAKLSQEAKNKPKKKKAPDSEGGDEQFW